MRRSTFVIRNRRRIALVRADGRCGWRFFDGDTEIAFGPSMSACVTKAMAALRIEESKSTL